MSSQLVLTEKHHRMIHKHAVRLHRKSGGRQLLADIKQAGYLALCEAHRRYDASKGSFDSFVYLRMRGAMLDEAVHADWHTSYCRRRCNGPMVDARQRAAVYTATHGTAIRDNGKRHDSRHHAIHPVLIASPVRAEDIDIKRVLERIPLSDREIDLIRKRLEGRNAAEVGVSRFAACRMFKAMVRRFKEEL